jgi:hypothetical protein
MSVIQVLNRPASQRFYAVAGRLLFVESLDPELAPAIERLFAGWQLAPVSSPERTPDVNITFTHSESLRSVPQGLYEFEVAEGGRCYSAGDTYYLKFANSLLHVGRNKNAVDVAVWVRKIPSPSDAELARVASFGVCAALRRFGMFELHSAGVVVPDSDAGVVIVGPSGSGKSTLTTQLARAGWSYLSDDELLLSLNENEVEARGFRSFFALADPKGTLKNCFEPAGVFTSPRVDKIAPQFVFFTQVSGAARTQWRALTQVETMSRLIRACPWATYDSAVAGANLDLLSRLARQTKAFDLVAGTDLLEPGRAARLLSATCRS